MRCKHCFEEKASDGFYKSNPTKCKECVKAAVVAHRQANREATEEIAVVSAAIAKDTGEQS